MEIDDLHLMVYSEQLSKAGKDVYIHEFCEPNDFIKNNY